MSTTLRLLAIAVLAAAAVACNKDKAAPPADAGTPAETAAPVTAAPAEPAPAPAPAPTDTAPVAGATGEPIGVAECDDFLTKYEACVNDKLPAESRAMFASSMTQWRDTWRGLAKDPATAATLATTCTQQKEAAKTSMAAYGCTDW